MRLVTNPTPVISGPRNGGGVSMRPVLGVGAPGRDGANVLPTDEAVAESVAAQNIPGQVSAAVDARDIPGQVVAAVAADSTVKIAASSAVSTELTNQGVLYATKAPALDTTRVPDPQVKTSGGVSTPTTMTLSRITTGLPTGFDYGIQSDRTGTLSSVIATPYFGSLTNTDPLRILVTVGETITAAAQVWTDQASARARMDIRWYDSTGALLSTTTGTYANIAASTWEQRYTTATVPASAAYCVPIASLATQSGNTVTGAKARLTGGIVVTGTVASPTYVDGGSSGWAWSGTAHASVAKKVFLSTSDIDARAQIKIDAHAAAADPHAVYLRKTKVPVLTTNRAIDPQAKTTGSASSASYTLSRITTGLPSGFDYGLKTVRTGTLSAVITTISMAPASASQADPLRIPVAPGEVISALAYGWTDQTSARARVDLQFFDASGAFLSTATGTYSNIAASTWESRVNAGATVPASAAYVNPQMILATQSGNTVTGAEARATGLIVVSGATPPTYGDGGTSGWDWTGTAHASTSVKLFNTTSVATTDAKPLTLTKSGNTLTLSRIFDTTKVLVQTLSLTGTANGTFNIGPTTLDGVTVHTGSDDIAPIRTQMGTVGGGHGYSVVAEFTNPDAKTTADLGSKWTDGTRQYQLLGITSGGKLLIGGSYTGSPVTSANVNPPANLTHVSGATHTGSIDYTTKVASSLDGVVARSAQTLIVDGKTITADGTYTAAEVVIRETGDLLDYGALYDWQAAHVGTDWTTAKDSIGGAVRVTSTYRFTARGCRVSIDLTEMLPTTLGQCGLVQAAALGDGATTFPKRYLPGVGTVSGFDWTAGVDLTSYSTDVVVATGDLVTTGRPPSVSVDVLPNTGTATIGFALGYLHWGARSDDATRASQRISRAATKLWDLRGTRKNYPTFTTAETAGWGHLRGEAFRAYLNPTQVAAVVAAKGDAVAAWDVVNTTANIVV